MNPVEQPNRVDWPVAKYWDACWNPVVGCRKVSEGCANCYAERVCEKFEMNGGAGFEPTVKPNAKPPKSGVVFVGNMTDIFGEWNDFDTIAVWLNMLHGNAANLILTKRAERMSAYMRERIQLSSNGYFWGITAENQNRLDERYFHLTNSLVNHKWLSLEPLLGPIDLNNVLEYDPHPYGVRERDRWLNRDIMRGWAATIGGGHDDLNLIPSWVVVGAESLGNRPGRHCRIEWVESIVAQCRSADVPVFVKQLHIGGKLVKDISKFPEHLRIRQVPWDTTIFKPKKEK